MAHVVEVIGVQWIIEDGGVYYLYTQNLNTGYWAFGLSLERARLLAEQFKNGYLQDAAASDQGD